MGEIKVKNVVGWHGSSKPAPKVQGATKDQVRRKQTGAAITPSEGQKYKGLLGKKAKATVPEKSKVNVRRRAKVRGGKK